MKGNQAMTHTLLFVDGDIRFLETMRLYFEAQGYIVVTATNGADAFIEAFQDESPDLIILNILDMSGYDFCRRLRENDKTITTPILFLTEREERSDKLFSLELGQDTFITKPVDVEHLKFLIGYHLELHLRQQSPLINSVSGNPSGKMLETHLGKLLEEKAEWVQIELSIEGYATYKDIYSWQGGEEVQKTFAAILIDACEQFGTEQDFIAHVSEKDFIVISHSPSYIQLIEHIKTRFADILTHYSFIDRERGFMMLDNQEVPLMCLAIKYEMRGVGE